MTAIIVKEFADRITFDELPTYTETDFNLSHEDIRGAIQRMSNKARRPFMWKVDGEDAIFSVIPQERRWSSARRRYSTDTGNRRRKQNDRREAIL